MPTAADWSPDCTGRGISAASARLCHSHAELCSTDQEAMAASPHASAVLQQGERGGRATLPSLRSTLRMEAPSHSRCLLERANAFRFPDSRAVVLVTGQDFDGMQERNSTKHKNVVGSADGTRSLRAFRFPVPVFPPPPWPRKPSTLRAPLSAGPLSTGAPRTVHVPLSAFRFPGGLLATTSALIQSAVEAGFPLFAFRRRICGRSGK